jgi:hypothetical protein
MRRSLRRPIILAMTRPLTPSKVLLVADRRAARSQGATAPVRRYRLARLRFEPPPVEGDSRFEYLKRSYD